MVLLLDYYSYERIIPFIYAKVSYMDTTFWTSKEKYDGRISENAIPCVEKYPKH